MADNTDLNLATSAGDKVVTREISHGGDTAKLQGVFAMGISGTEGSYTAAAIGGDAANGLDVDVTRVSGNVTVVDGGSSLTVDGTVELGATTLAALESITVVDGGSTISIDDGAGSITVDGTVAATQSGTWNVGTVTTVTTVSAVTAISNALPAGTNNIGDVDVLSIVPGTSATSLGKAEDAAHTTGDTGVMVLAVRNDAGTALAGTTGDYIPLSTDANGALRVVGSSGTTQYTEDAASAGGESLCLAGFVRQDTIASSTSLDGDYAYGKVNANGAQYVAIESGGITGRAEDSAHSSGHEGVVILAVRRDSASSGVDTDGDYATLSVDSSGNLRTTGSSGITSYTEDAASAGAESLVLMGAVRRDTAASSSGTDGDYSTLNTDANGRLHTIAALAASQTLATVTTVSTVTNVATIGTSVTPGTSAAHLGKAEDAAHASGDTGVMSLGVRSDTAAASSGTTGDYEPFHTDSVGAIWTRSTGELADDAAFTPGTSRVLPVGFTADESSTDSVDEGDIGAARMTLDRKQIVASYAHAAGGATPGRLVSAASTNGTVVKASAGTLYTLVVTNLNAAVRYLKVYNSTSVTVGTTTPTWTFAIPASTTGAGFNVPIPACGIAFGTGICLGTTTGVADNDTGAVAANEIIANYAYI